LRLRSSSRKTPIIRLVTMLTPGVRTPRAVMQAWLASITTATPRGLQVVPDALRDFGGQPFLDLQSPGKAVQHARQLGNADDMVLRQVGNRRLADDRRHVVFAMRLERNVLEQHDFVIAAHFLEHARQVDCRVVG
jgi:hypothetical protein